MRELFLTSLGGIQYGIWKDEIKSVSDIDALHRIPLSPACIAGITIVDGHTVTLADIPVCMGYEATCGVKQGNILIKEEGENVIGFVVSGEIRTQSISPRLLFSLPDFLKTPVFDSCAVHDDIPIPLINTTVLHAQVLEFDGKSSADTCQIYNAQPQDISAMARIRIFSAGGELFAVSAAGMEDEAVKPGRITPLPNTPRYVKGVTFWKGRLLPVIDLSQLIIKQSVATDALMLVTEIGGATFGLLIDGDGEILPTNIVSIKPAPFIVQTSWLKYMMVRAGELIPLIDLAKAFSSCTNDDKPVWQRYSPDVGFNDLLFNRAVEVMEFSLLSERHALPKVEVEDVIDFKSCRVLPDVSPIVIGVAEHKGDVLPVVDLAMMFGRRSLATSSWRMMLVKNGDFRALVITETVLGERLLALEIQRVVPIHLPHQFVYGCYPDTDVVRLIMNVETISVYFERAHIKKFLPALSHEMRQSPTGVVYNFPEVKIVEESMPSVTAAPEEIERAEPEPAVVDEPTAELSEHLVVQDHQQKTEDVEPTEIQEADETYSETQAEPEKVEVVRRVPLSVSAQQSLPFSDELAQREQAQRERAYKNSAAASMQAEKVQGSVQAKTRGMSGTQTVIPLTRRVAGAAPEASRPSVTVNPKKIERPSGTYRTYFEEQSIIRERKRRIAYGVIAVALIAVIFYFAKTSNKPVVEQSVKVAEPAKIEQVQAVIEPPLKTKAELAKEKDKQAKKQADLVRVQAAQASLEASQAKVKAKAEREAKVKAEHEARLKVAQEAKAKAQVEREEKLKVMQEAKAKAQAEREARLKSAQEAKALMKAERESKLKAAQEAKPSQALVLSQQAKIQTAPPRLAEKFNAPLELDIPKHMPPVDIDVYVVVHGDTLWNISQRFTGNPFNYPRIAGENKIANPNLIFPGQRVRLIK
jgi:chemotaxis signal transduction protein/nucleoid-associated protein YgaU